MVHVLINQSHEDDENILHNIEHTIFEYQLANNESDTDLDKMLQESQGVPDYFSNESLQIDDAGLTLQQNSDNIDNHAQPSQLTNDKSSGIDENDEDSSDNDSNNTDHTTLQITVAKLETDFVTSKLSFEKDLSIIQTSLEEITDLKSI